MDSTLELRGFLVWQQLLPWGWEEGGAGRERERGPQTGWDAPSEGPLGSLLTWSSFLSCFHFLLGLQCLRSKKEDLCPGQGWGGEGEG